MKFKLTILFLFITLATTAQVTPILREYRCDFLRDSTLYVYSWVGGIGGKLVPVANHKFAEGDGGLYHALYRKANGEVYIIEGQSTTLRFLQYDTLNIPFKAIAIECHLQTNYAVRQDGSIWMTGKNTPKWFSPDPERTIARWAKIPGQPAVKFRHVTKGGANGNGVLVATTESGEVWTLNDGSTTWVKKSLPGPVQKVYASESNFYIVLIDGQPYGWGQSRYLTGITGIITGYIGLASYWGLSGKIIDLAVNGQTVHYITDDHRLWGYGDNSMGEVGVGWELVNRRELYKGKQYVWGWVTAVMAAYQQMAWVNKPAHIVPGILFRRVFGGGYYSFYKYAQDLSGNIYSWGRNKAGVLSNGLAVSNESDLPNWGDVTKPTPVNPFTYVIPVPSLFVSGKVTAGPDQSILTNSTQLNGTATPSGSKNFSYPITKWEWRKISGPEVNIWHTASGVAQVTGLTSGSYSFELKVTDSTGGTMADTVLVNVTIVNIPPTVEAYCNTTIGNSTIMIAKATDIDGRIVGMEWNKIAGPAGDTIKYFRSDAIQVSFTVPGEYTYRFTGCDDSSACVSVDVKLVVYEIKGGNYIIIRKR